MTVDDDEEADDDAIFLQIVVEDFLPAVVDEVVNDGVDEKKNKVDENHIFSFFRGKKWS